MNCGASCRCGAAVSTDIEAVRTAAAAALSARIVYDTCAAVSEGRSQRGKATHQNSDRTGDRGHGAPTTTEPATMPSTVTSAATTADSSAASAARNAASKLA